MINIYTFPHKNFLITWKQFLWQQILKHHPCIQVRTAKCPACLATYSICQIRDGWIWQNLTLFDCSMTSSSIWFLWTRNFSHLSTVLPTAFTMMGEISSSWLAISWHFSLFLGIHWAYRAGHTDAQNEFPDAVFEPVDKLIKQTSFQLCCYEIRVSNLYQAS